MVKTTDDIQDMVHKTIDWYVVGRVQPAYCSFRKGVQALGALYIEAMRNHSDAFHEAFCYTPEVLTASNFETLFPEVTRQCEGSNRRLVENLVLSQWRDFLQDTEEDTSALSFSDIRFLQKLPIGSDSEESQ